MQICEIGWVLLQEYFVVVDVSRHEGDRERKWLIRIAPAQHAILTHKVAYFTTLRRIWLRPPLLSRLIHPIWIHPWGNEGFDPTLAIRVGIATRIGLDTTKRTVARPHIPEHVFSEVGQFIKLDERDFRTLPRQHIGLVLHMREAYLRAACKRPGHRTRIGLATRLGINLHRAFPEATWRGNLLKCPPEDDRFKTRVADMVERLKQGSVGLTSAGGSSVDCDVGRTCQKRFLWPILWPYHILVRCTFLDFLGTKRKQSVKFDFRIMQPHFS